MTPQVANNAGAAGFVMLCIFNFALLIILGFVRARLRARCPLSAEFAAPRTSGFGSVPRRLFAALRVLPSRRGST